MQGTRLLDSQAVVDAARDAASHGASCFGLVNSGLGPTDQEIETFAQAMRQIRCDGSLDLCASLGILTESQTRPGPTRRPKVQPQPPDLAAILPADLQYAHVRSTHRYDSAVKKAGILACCGGLFGMGETWEDRVDLAMELHDLQVDTIPINFLIPIPGTPLEGQAWLSTIECLKIIAVYRFMLPNQTIQVCGGREVHLRDLQSWIFLAGANGLLIGNYLTTCGRSAAQDLQMVSDLGLPLKNAVRAGDPAQALQDQISRYVPTSEA